MTLAFFYSKLVQKLHGKSIKNSRIHKTSRIYESTNFYGSTIGKYSYVSYDSKVINTDIGNFCSISSNVTIGEAEHPLDWASTSPVFQEVNNSGSSVRFARHVLPQPKRTTIGHDVWIGHRAIVKAGVTIGTGAVVGAGAIVTKDVAPYAIVAGVPAKLIRYRFDNQIIKELLATEWWNAEDRVLSDVGEYVKNPQEFINRFNLISKASNEEELFSPH